MNRAISILTFIAVLFGVFLLHPTYIDFTYKASYGGAVVRLLGPAKNGGGTGFQVQYKDKKFILTNDHVCELGEKENKLIVVSPLTAIGYADIISRSGYSDLCILSGVSSLPSLILGREEFKRFEHVAVLGHPKLGPLTLSQGSVRGTSMIDVLLGYIQSPEDEAACKRPKNRIESIYFGFITVCLAHVRGQHTTAIIYPGSSGSPVLDMHGYVKGVAFASKQTDNQADIIPLNDILKFINATYKRIPVLKVH